MASIITNIVSLKVNMGQSLIFISDEVAQFYGTLITNMVSSEIQAQYHVFVFQEVAKLFNMLVCNF